MTQAFSPSGLPVWCSGYWRAGLESKNQIRTARLGWHGVETPTQQVLYVSAVIPSTTKIRAQHLLASPWIAVNLAGA